MRRFLIGAAWLLPFAAVGMVVLPLLGWFATHKMPRLTPETFAAGAELGLDLYLFLLFFEVLPGTRRAGPAPPLGPGQAVWSLVGFVAMLCAGGLASYNVLIVADLLLDLAKARWPADLGSRDAVLASAFGGEVAAAYWVLWVVERAGPAQFADGAPAGIAWRPARPAAYGAAVLCAAAIIGIVVTLFTFIPPDLKALDDVPMAKLFDGGGWELLPLLALVVLVAPVVEEVVFRGIAFTGFARQFGPLWASVITTVVFMAVHAQEKLHYLPGFIDVGLVAAAACWLRVKFASIRPGILLHILYNTGLMLAAGLVH